MENVLIAGAWLIFAGLVIHVFQSKNVERSDLNTRFIRKVWYLFFLLGALLYLTGRPDSLINDWENYLIILVSFVIIDSLFFLELHFSKVGGQELKSTKEQVGITQKQLDNVLKGTENIRLTLTGYEFPLYYDSRDQCFKDMENLFKQYGKISGLVIDLYPYNSEDEQNELLENLGSYKRRAQRLLKGNNIFVSNRDNIGLYPFNYLGETFVVQAHTINEDRNILEVDGEALSILFIVFDLSVRNNIKESGDNDDN